MRAYLCRSFSKYVYTYYPSSDTCVHRTCIHALQNTAWYPITLHLHCIRKYGSYCLLILKEQTICRVHANSMPVY